MNSDTIALLIMSTYIVWLVGVAGSAMVMRYRAGIGHGRLRVFGPNGFGPAWIATSIALSLAWPITLAVWLYKGRPEPRVVFNHRAEERQRRQAAGL